MNIKELRKYNNYSRYSNDDIAEKLMQISYSAMSLLENSTEIQEDLENALYQLECMAQNEYTMTRTLYNILLIITAVN